MCLFVLIFMDASFAKHSCYVLRNSLFCLCFLSLEKSVKINKGVKFLNSEQLRKLILVPVNLAC